MATSADASSSTAEQLAVVNNKTKVSEAQIRRFLQLCWTKYVKAKIEPGESCSFLTISSAS